MNYKEEFEKRLQRFGQTAMLHTEAGGQECPCYDSATGYHDPEFHRENPGEPTCNKDGRLSAVVTEKALKCFIQPVGTFRATMLETKEDIKSVLGDLERGRFVLICSSDQDLTRPAQADYMEYLGIRYKIVNPRTYFISDQAVYNLCVLERG